MTTILVPYHQDDALPPDDIDIHADVTVVPDFPQAARWERLAAGYEAVATAVAKAGGVPVVLSGDCLIAGAVVAGVQRAGTDPAIVWFDAHGDLHTLGSSTSGYLGGLSLRLVMGAHRDDYANRFGLRPVSPDRAVLVDARDLDPAEADYLAAGVLRRIPVTAVDAASVPAGPLVLHVDLDVIDAAEVPRLRFPVPGGPAAAEVLAAAERLVASGRVVALHIACPWFPADDDSQRETRAALLARFAALVNPSPLP